MEGYAPAYVDHNIPLVLVFGLGSSRGDGVRLQNGGTRISSEIPPVETEDARTLLRHLEDSDASDLAWNGREHNGRNKLRVKAVGRVLQQTQCPIYSQ